MALSADLTDLIERTPGLLLRHNLYQSLDDPKFAEKTSIIFVPANDYDDVAKTNTRDISIELYDPSKDPHYYEQGDRAHALLYLPFPYLVPGGRFNEMYGWDSAFPVFAWIKDHPKLMREQIDNQIYQIRHYGKVLNSNRAYHLGRSHPPLISRMIMALLETDLPWESFDPEGRYASRTDWLEKAYDALVAYHAYWTSGDRLAGDTGLSRYWDELDIPAPEVAAGEIGHFSHAVEHFRQMLHIESEIENTRLFYDADAGELTPLYYRADRAMRASGFDPTGHWNYGALRCLFYAPVCLNSFLFRMEKDLALIADRLNKPHEWDRIALQRKLRMIEHLWENESGTFQDYDFKFNVLNPKPFANLFFPLWSGLLDSNDDREKIDRIVSYALGQLEQPYGLSTSAEVSGSQWDHPYGWPPLHYFACDALKRNGFVLEAERIASKFCNLVQSVFDAENSMYEKYNVLKGNSEVRVVNGYDVNVHENGTFLWTAAVTRILVGIAQI